jgi:hypothetical protein
MGWFSSEHEHEGYVVGFVTAVKNGHRASGVYRELGYLDDDDQAVEKIAAACDCGWRSPMWMPDRWHDSEGKFRQAEFWPHTVDHSPDDHEKALGLWNEHVAHACSSSWPRSATKSEVKDLARMLGAHVSTRRRFTTDWIVEVFDDATNQRVAYGEHPSLPKAYGLAAADLRALVRCQEVA